MNLNVNIQGWEQVVKKLDKVPEILRDRILLPVMKDAVAMAEKTAQQTAPVANRPQRVKRFRGRKDFYIRQPGTVKKSIGLVIPKRPWKNTVYVGIGTIQANTPIEKRPWFAHMITKRGTKGRQLNKWMQAAWDKHESEMIAQVEAGIKKDLIKYNFNKL